MVINTNGMVMMVMIRPTNDKIECWLKQLKKDLRHKSKEGSSYQNLPGKKSGFYKMKTSQWHAFNQFHKKFDSKISSFQKEPGAGKSDLRPENGTKWVFCGEFVPIAHPFLPRFTHIAPPLILLYTTEIECQQECIYYNVVWTFCTDCHYSVEIHHAEACVLLWWCKTSLAWFESS